MLCHVQFLSDGAALGMADAEEDGETFCTGRLWALQNTFGAQHHGSWGFLFY